jgi:hypothetical protein
MSDFIDRMKIERAELQERLEKLNAFFVTETFKGLTPVEQSLMLQQHVIMVSYYGVLSLRLRILGHD